MEELSAGQDVSATRVAVVTGAARGIGREVAHHLAGAGCAVAVWDRNPDGAEATAEALRRGGGTAVAHRVDVRFLDAVCAAVRGVLDAFGRIDVLVNAAAEMALEGRKPLWELEEQQWRETLEGCFLVAVVPCRAVVPVMLQQGFGRIINISSDAAHVGEAKAVTYSAAKAAVEGFTRALARSVGRSGITVNCVSPGMVRTPYTMGWLTPELEARVTEQYPAGRIGEPRDIARTVAFLASPEADWITGQVIHVNGGFYSA